MLAVDFSQSPALCIPFCEALVPTTTTREPKRVGAEVSFPSNKTQPPMISNASVRLGMISGRATAPETSTGSHVVWSGYVNPPSLTLDQDVALSGPHLGFTWDGGCRTTIPYPDTSWLFPTTVNSLRTLFSSEYSQLYTDSSREQCVPRTLLPVSPHMTQHTTFSPCHSLVAAASYSYFNLFLHKTPPNMQPLTY